MKTINNFQDFVTGKVYTKTNEEVDVVCPTCKGTGKIVQKPGAPAPAVGKATDLSQYQNLPIKDPKNKQFEELEKAIDPQSGILRDVKAKLVKRPEDLTKPVGPQNPVFGKISFGDPFANKQKPGISLSVNSGSNKAIMFYPSFEDANKINQAANEVGLTKGLKTNYTDKDFNLEFSGSNPPQLFVSYTDYSKVVDFVNKLKEVYPDKFKKS